MLNYKKLTLLSLKTHPEIDEKWVQKCIEEDTSLLNLGEVILKDRERNQPRAGRLDLLLQEVDGNRRFAVEIQLGKTDASHIVRTIEYWDIERKLHKKYDHIAVIVAEDITSRFLNVISLFNGTIPLIAIQMQAVQIDNVVSLVFTTVLDHVPYSMEDEEEVYEATDRVYWESRSSKTTVAMADEMLEILKQFDQTLVLKYNKFYIGLARQGQADNFVIFRPQRNAIRVEPRLTKNEEIEQKIESVDLDVMDYDNRWGRYRIRLRKGEVKKHTDILKYLFKMAYDESVGEDNN